MTSFWNWLCFPRNRFVAGKTQNKPKRRRNKGNVVTLQKRKLLDDINRFQDVPTVSDYGAIQSPTQQQNVPNKRRRIQDIFNTEPVPSIEEVSTQHDNYTHMKVPHLFYQQQKDKRPQCDNVESMYGYVPKTVQNIYTSTALEGEKIEDYFTNLHNDMYFSKFANTEISTIDKTDNSLQIPPFTRVPSSVSVHEEKLSLIETDDSDDDMEIGQFGEFPQWQTSFSRTDYDIEDSFQSMMNSREEVLY